MKEILREYDTYRQEQQEALKQREMEVMSALPELARLRHSLVTYLAQKARTLILNPDINPADEQEETWQKISVKRKALLMENDIQRTISPFTTDVRPAGTLLCRRIGKKKSAYTEISGTNLQLFRIIQPDKENFNTLTLMYFRYPAA